MIAYTNMIIVVCSLLYLGWEWHTDPGASWQFWAVRLSRVLLVIWGFTAVVRQSFAE